MLRKYIIFLKCVTLTQLHASSMCTAETPGGTTVRYQTIGVIKKGKIVCDPGSRKPVETKKTE